ncbi:helix-turn-helix transcriptional regulator [Salmonella enterica subsp. enterica serovar Minnesota]|nr:helix-turn-helix transcriptional regulator [Salmonella enterica subsp. enterica serovar Minnesota]
MLKLTKKEKDICQMILSGDTNKEISNKTHRSVHTINAHIKNVYRNNNIKNRIQLCRALFMEEYVDEKQQ